MVKSENSWKTKSMLPANRKDHELWINFSCLQQKLQELPNKKLLFLKNLHVQGRTTQCHWLSQITSFSLLCQPHEWPYSHGLFVSSKGGTSSSSQLSNQRGQWRDKKKEEEAILGMEFFPEIMHRLLLSFSLSEQHHITPSSCKDASVLFCFYNRGTLELS